MENIRISVRLKEISKHIPKASFFADIGSDHAYLPSYVCLNDKEATAIAGEVNKGPYNKAKEVVNTFQLNNRIDVRLGDGLSVLESDEPDTLVIAGMGGKLIEYLLNKDLNKTLKINKLILQQNLDAKLIEDNANLYEILVTEKSNKSNVYSESIDLEKQIYFGPYLIKERSVEFINKWEEEKKKLSRIIKEMKQAKLINHKKVNQFTKKLNWIEEVLSNESCNKQ